MATIPTLTLYDYIGWGGIVAADFAAQLEAIPKGAKQINLKINSPGGSVYDARQMVAMLNDRNATVEVDITGLCCSAATYLACCGDVVRIVSDGLYMIHAPATTVSGEADDLRKEADLLDKIMETIISTYTAFTGKTRGTIAKLVAAETWMDAQEAIDAGFVHELIPARKTRAAASGNRTPGPRMREAASMLAEQKRMLDARRPAVKWKPGPRMREATAILASQRRTLKLAGVR